MNQSLNDKYQQLIKDKTLAVDALQQSAIEQLSLRLTALEDGVKQSKQHSLTGLYLHGRVGRGKTLLMDMFFEQVTAPKMRLHFHHFMFLLHQKLTEIQGQVDPLDYIAKELAQQARVICFDEFFVNDIADAMLLGGVFNALHKHQVMIIATSNTAPKDLYAGGLARDRFLPTIALIKRHLQYFSLDGDIDYRTTFTQYNAIYFKHQQGLLDYADQVNLTAEENLNIEIFNRKLPVKAVNDSAVWFDFMTLCDGPRSQNDYIKLADKFNVLLLSDVVQLGGKVNIVTVVKGTEDGDTNYLISPASPIEVGLLDDVARRLIALVDEFYDRQKLIVIRSDVPMNSLYQGGRVTAAFERTYSRLLEMQSVDYQAKVMCNHQARIKALFADI
ncbi:MAG: cell division protein ZapE [Psychrobium sp.]|nr:cell division protein ZapE [Psychrobium sp.]